MGVGQEHGLVDDATLGVLTGHDGRDGFQGVLGLLAQRGAAARDGAGKDVVDLVQRDNCVTDAWPRVFANGVRGHEAVL